MKKKNTTGDIKVKEKNAEELTFTFGSTPEEFSELLSITSLLFGAIAILFKVNFNILYYLKIVI